MENVQEIFTDKIKLPPNNMREYIDRDEIFELAKDIEKNGLISPITIRPVGDEYELVAGQRRYLAHQYSGILKIKCIVKELNDEQAFAIMTSENLARVDVNPVDEAKHVARLMEYNKDDIKKVMHIVGRGEQWVKDCLSIAQMPDYMQAHLAGGNLKKGVALILTQITDDRIRRLWTEEAVLGKVNIQTAQYWLDDFKARSLSGGDFSGAGAEQANLAPPQAVMYECAVDGEKYDIRMFKTVMIYEGNLQYFFAFRDAFRNPAD